MPRREQFARTGLWLACGGLVVLAAHQLLTVHVVDISVDKALLLIGAIAGYLITATGIGLSLSHRPRRHAASDSGSPSPFPPSSALQTDGATPLHDVARRMAASFVTWCEEDLPGAGAWNSFDQFIRELLAEQLGAVRVRCYQVLPGNQQLRSLSQLEAQADGNLDLRCARSGILGYVATSGQDYVAADPTHGELVQQLAADADEPWDWVFSVRQAGQTAGLVAVGKLPSATLLERGVRQEISVLVTAFWKYVTCLEQLRLVEKTDKASGLLTRADFFDVATHALADSYAENEPVVVVVLALEGLRRLDDTGRWHDRDALIEAIGQLVKRRIRTDDIIGRFSDDRFVMLLRRLDSGLGRLIAAKVQTTADERMAQLDNLGDVLRVRVGVAGSGFERQPLESLLATAFEAVELARRRNVPLHCDLATVKPETVTG